MSIKSDADSILKYIVGKKQTNSDNISTYFEFEKNRTRDALRYLEEKGFISVKAKTVGGNWLMINPSAQGIDFEEESLQEQQIQKTRVEDSKKPIQKETVDQILRIERSINSLQSREYRKINYNASLYPLIIASFIAIGFTSSIEFIKMILPKKYMPLLTGGYYFLILISILIASYLFEKMRKNLDVDNYVALIKIDAGTNKFKLVTQIRKIFEANDHQLSYFRPSFEGFLWHDFPYYIQSRKTNQDRKEEILKDGFGKQTKDINFGFDYVNRKGVISYLTFDMANLKIKVDLDKGTDHKTADKILKDIMAVNGLAIIEKTGWDH